MRNIKVHFNAFGDKRENVFEFYADTKNDEASCEYVYHMSNAPEEILNGLQYNLAKKWRALKLRSLSVGDTVQVGNRKFQCESFGWKEL